MGETPLYMYGIKASLAYIAENWEDNHANSGQRATESHHDLPDGVHGRLRWVIPSLWQQPCFSAYRRRRPNSCLVGTLKWFVGAVYGLGERRNMQFHQRFHRVAACTASQG